jgi:hypothetical protein
VKLELVVIEPLVFKVEQLIAPDVSEFTPFVKAPDDVIAPVVNVLNTELPVDIIFPVKEIVFNVLNMEFPVDVIFPVKEIVFNVLNMEFPVDVKFPLIVVDFKSKNEPVVVELTSLQVILLVVKFPPTKALLLVIKFPPTKASYCEKNELQNIILPKK